MPRRRRYSEEPCYQNCLRLSIVSRVHDKAYVSRNASEGRSRRVLCPGGVWERSRGRSRGERGRGRFLRRLLLGRIVAEAPRREGQQHANKQTLEAPTRGRQMRGKLQVAPRRGVAARRPLSRHARSSLPTGLTRETGPSSTVTPGIVCSNQSVPPVCHLYPSPRERCTPMSRVLV